MAAHELPEWEGPAASSTPQTPFWQRLSQQLNSNNLRTNFKPSASQNATTVGPKSSLPPTQHFDDKESIVSIPATQAHTAGREDPSTSTHVVRGRLRARSRRRFSNLFVALIVAAVLLLALIIGLAVGLTRHKKSSAKDLPLPTNAGIFTGDLTYYSPGPGYGACGFENTSQDSICAVSHIIWDASSTSSNPNSNPLCGRKIRITRYDPTVNGNRSVDVEVVDRCVGCKATDLDLSLKMFDSLAEESQGRVVGSWAWL